MSSANVLYKIREELLVIRSGIASSADSKYLRVRADPSIIPARTAAPPLWL